MVLWKALCTMLVKSKRGSTCEQLKPCPHALKTLLVTTCPVTLLHGRLVMMPVCWCVATVVLQDVYACFVVPMLKCCEPDKPGTQHELLLRCVLAVALNLKSMPMPKPCTFRRV